MRILAIETTEIAGSVAALEADRLLAARDLDSQMRSAQSLAPALAALLQSTGWNATDVELVAVAVGPGSFTGLRVGITTAKLFAYAVGAGVMGIDTLEVIAAQAPAEVDQVWAAMDAQRGQVFAAQFIRDPADSVGRWERRGEEMLLDNSAWLAQLSPGQAVSGPVLDKLANQLPSGVVAVEQKLWWPKAATVGQLAWQQFQSGRRDDVFGLVPQYFRPSAAEEKRTAEANPQRAKK